MSKNKKKIVLLLAGGTLLLDKHDRVVFVNGQKDIDNWLQQMPELSILVDIEPIFICGEDEVITPQIWEKMAEVIVKQQDQADGFVVVSKVENLINTTLALSFLLQNFKKTIISTASQISGTDFIAKKDIIKQLKKKHGGLGLRSNLINALQIADQPLPGPAIMFGTRLVPACQAINDYDNDINLFASINNSYWGKVDFGVSIKSGLSYSSQKPNFYNKISSNILVIEDISGVPWMMTKDYLKNYQAVLIKLSNKNNLETDKQQQINKWKMPVVIYNYENNVPTESAVSLTGCTWSTAIIKTMWAVAKQENLTGFNKIMKQNIIGEFINN
jgi:L-asparaginase/Glu-tRNA(Gln) amidotransferase subunit D